MDGMLGCGWLGEQMTEKFITESFRKLRSAEGAFELVQNFQKIGGGGSGDPAGGGGALSAPGGHAAAGSSIKQQISDRYKDILEQYMREMDSVKRLFSTYKDKPIIHKNFPPVAGAISWARNLYLRAKKPILRFKKRGGLLDDAFGEKVKASYLEFARSVDSYITDLFNDWEAGVSAVVSDRLKQPVLRSIAAYSTSKQAADKGSEPGNFVLPPPPYRVSFAHDLKMIIRESRYLDKLGFRIPEVRQ